MQGKYKAPASWKRYYRGWVIKHDPLGKLACYRTATTALEWCYFGDNVQEIKAEIDRREFDYENKDENP